MKTENVDKLSIPFGTLIGPCTIVLNVVKLIEDVAKIAFNGLLNVKYTPSQAYKDFKAADLAWIKNVSSKHKPQVSNEGYIQRNYTSYTDPEYIATIDQASVTLPFHNYSTTYKALSPQDKRQVAFEQAKQDSIQHLTFIGIGIIRSIPLVGGCARWVYNEIKK